MITAHGIVRTYATLAYDAVAVSPQDMNAGKDFFTSSLANGFPWISANILDEKGQLVFPPTMVVKRAGAPDIGIIGLTGRGENDSDWAQIGDWRKALPEHLARLKSTCGPVVLLSNLSDDENAEIAKNFHEIDIIITSSPTRYGNQPPQASGNGLITQSDGRGKYLGKLELTWQRPGPWAAAQETGTSTRQESTAVNSFLATFLPVRPGASGDEVDTIVQDIKKSINAYQKVRLRENGPIDQLAGERLQLAQFAGSAACKSCHERQSAFWSETAHARAFATLVNSGQNYNPECLPCHVTGGNISALSSFAQKDLLLVLPENRQAVGCETCHGPGRQHADTPAKVQVLKPTKQKCIGCHTPEHDDAFDFAVKMNSAACPLDR